MSMTLNTPWGSQTVSRLVKQSCVLLAMIAGGALSPAAHGGGACQSHADCNDNNGCTTDLCQSGQCVHQTQCEAGCDDGNPCTTSHCTPDGCCKFKVECAVDADCPDDGNGCTSAVCTAEGCCESRPLCDSAADCNDGNPCTVDHCAPGGCCKNKTECAVAADCPDDGNGCTAAVCTAGGCCQTRPACTSAADCNDSNGCTADQCTVNGCCNHVDECVDDDDCPDDGNLCTTELCTSEGCCEAEPVSCPIDNNPCTREACTPADGVCRSQFINPPPPGCELPGQGEEGGEGCTPGFWKQPHHFQFWPDGYETDQRVNAVFGVTSTSNPTLLAALSTGGGGEIAFLRHAVAALLNAAHDEVDFGLTLSEVKDLVDEAYDAGEFERIKGILADENEDGCSVDTSSAGDNGNDNNSGNANHGQSGHRPLRTDKENKNRSGN